VRWNGGFDLQTSPTSPTCSFVETFSRNPSTWSCIRKAGRNECLIFLYIKCVVERIHRMRILTVEVKAGMAVRNVSISTASPKMSLFRHHAIRGSSASGPSLSFTANA
jgi:hypothetical protein